MILKGIIRLTLLIIIVIDGSAYLELELVRVPHPSKHFKYMKNQCFSEIPSAKQLLAEEKNDQDNSQDDDDQDEDDKKIEGDDDFKQICYDKDISYAIQLFNKQDELLLFSLDLTTPISWMKGESCHIGRTHKKCTRIDVTLKNEIEAIQKKLKELLKHPFDSSKKKRKDNEYALIEGSSQVVKGILEKSSDLFFQTKDSGRLTRITDVLLLGLAIIGEKDILNLHNTTFIKATEISPNLNYLCDGAISLRFDENSENSFLNEISHVIRNTEKYVTIFIGEHNQSITIGDISVKNSADGLSGIHWISAQQHDKYGKLPMLKQIWISSQNSESHKEIKIKKPLVLTMSSSAITIPQQIIKQIIEHFFKKASSHKKCQINSESGYIQCTNLTSSERSELQHKQLNFVTKQNPISIPISSLILDSQKHKTVLNIRNSSDSEFVILGEPIFKKYFIVLDYQNNRIGVAKQRVKFMDKVLDIVFLIRFVVWIFIFGCCCILLVNPIDKCWRILREKKYKSKIKGTGQRSHLNQYKRLEQNPYDELQGKIQEALRSDNLDEAEGI